MTIPTPQDRARLFFHNRMTDGQPLASVVRDILTAPALADIHEAAIDFALETAAGKSSATKELRFTPSPERYARWSKAANAAGISITAWVQLAADGLLVRSEETTTAPLQETTQDRNSLARPESGWLRERIVAEVGDRPLGKSEVPALADRLGEERRKVFASLNSAVNSKRATFDGNVYHFVKE